jgi:hypothetical protein
MSAINGNGNRPPLPPIGGGGFGRPGDGGEGHPLPGRPRGGGGRIPGGGRRVPGGGGRIPGGPCPHGQHGGGRVNPFGQDRVQLSGPEAPAGNAAEMFRAANS